MPYCRKCPDAVARTQEGMEVPRLSGYVQFYQQRAGLEPPFVSKTANLQVKRRFGYVNDTKYYELLQCTEV